MHRQVLLLLVSLFITTAITFSCAPFWLSLAPSQRAQSTLLSIDLASLEVGDRRDVIVNRYHVFVRRTDEPASPYSVYYIPVLNELYQLPEFDWKRARLPCRDFIQKDRFQCWDSYPEGRETVWWNAMSWDQHGRYTWKPIAGNHIPNLPVPRYKIKNNKLIFINFPY